MLENEVLDLLKQAEVIAKEDELEKSPQEEFGDLAFPCFNLAKVKKMNPNEIAKEISNKIEIPKDSFIKKIEVRGPYVNFYYNYSELSKLLLEKIFKEKNNYGSSNVGERKKVMVEFCHANTHKGFHIGHFRNICIGESLSRILEFTGHKVIRVNYQGDIGPHVAKCLWGVLKLYKGKHPEENKGEWLGKVYAEANKKVGTNKKLEKEVDEINKKIYAGDKELTKLWKETRKWNLEDFDKIYKELDTKFDRLYFESEVEKRGLQISKTLVKRGIAKISEGAMVIYLEKFGLGVIVLVTKGNTPLYGAKDLGLAENQFYDFNPDKIIHVVGAEQKLYFKQLFKIFELIKSPAANKSYHLVYDLVNLKEGKISSRLGTIVLYSELRDKVKEKVLEEIQKRNPKPTKKEDLTNIIAIGSMKYGMLKISPEKLITFDWKEALNLEGNTGSYLQYTHTRASSILKKSGKWEPSFSIKKLNDEEKRLIKTFSEFLSLYL